MFAAIENVGKEIVIIKDNKIIAKGKGMAMRGDDFVSIKLQDEDVEKFFNEFSKDTIDLIKPIGHLRYFPTSGLFYGLSLDFSDDKEENASKVIEEKFSDTIAVDYFNLTYGLVPEHFKEAEGFKSAIKD